MLGMEFASTLSYWMLKDKVVIIL